MSINDPFLKVGVSGNSVEVKTRTGMVILRAVDETPLKAIKRLRKCLDALDKERKNPTTDQP